jgi:hypothetical protein
MSGVETLPGAPNEPAPDADAAHAVVEGARSLVDVLAAAGVTARLLGGVAVALRCPQAALPPSPLARSYSDLDIVVAKSDRRRLPEVLGGLEFQAAERFNAMSGHVRQLYTSKDGVDLDVFVEQFKMCHELDLKDRLQVDARTLPLADLVLTKLQVADLTDKDIRDYAALTLDHELTDDDGGIGVARICAVTGGDWGWWRTVTENLGKVIGHVDRLGLAPPAAAAVRAQTEELVARIDAGPKSLRWKARARVGDRMAWREDPEEKR